MSRKNKICKKCGLNRNGYTFHEKICSTCYTLIKERDYKDNGIIWLKECNKCHKRKNAFEDFNKTYWGTPRGECKECLKKYNKKIWSRKKL